MYELKIYRGVSYAMKMKNDAKFGEESTCCFTVDMRIVDLTNFDPNTRKSQKSSL